MLYGWYKIIRMLECKKCRKQHESENPLKGKIIRLIQSHHLMGNRWRNSGNSVRLYFSGLQNHYRW